MGLFNKSRKPMVVNPATGQIMPSGKGGYDTSGNLYGQNKAFKPSVFPTKHTTPAFPRHSTPHFTKQK
jgi:hypothetical protein